MNLEKLLHTKYPIIQGGMAWVADGAFAASVSNNGAMGLIATGGRPVEEIRKEIEKCRQLTDKPFGLNVLMLHWDVEAISDLVVEYNIPFVTTGAGNPGKYIPKWKANGTTVFPVVPTKALAMRMERAGADGVICEGTEAGGHVGELTTMVLVNEVKDAVSIPVVAAGGICNGRSMLAAEALGACGVQLGTILLASDECPIHPNYKEKLVQAKSTAVKVIGRINGLPTRVVKNRMVQDYLELEKSGADREELEQLTHAALGRAVREGDMERGSIMAGQVVEAIKEIRPLKQIFEELMAEYEQEKVNLLSGGQE